MTRSVPQRRGLIAGLMVLSLAFSGLGMSAGFAADTATTTEGTASPSAITNTNVELVIHKYTPSTKSDAELAALTNGKEITNVGTNLPGAQTVEGVTFVPYQVMYDGQAIDLKTNAGWALLSEFQKLFDPNKTANSWTYNGKNFTLTKKTGKATTTDGSVRFQEAASEVTKTAYIFKEELPADMTKVKVGGQALGAKETLATVSPFLVTLPMTDPTALNTWMYTVHVYPKNSKTSINKKVSDQTAPGSGVTNGSPIKYEISTEIPKADAGFAEFFLVDALPKELEYTGAATGTLDTVEVGTYAGDKFTKDTNVTLSSPADYSIINVKSTVDQKTYVTVQFTDAGKQKLQANAKKSIRWIVNTKVNVGTGATMTHEVTNTANLITVPTGNPSSGWNPNTSPNTPPQPGQPTVPGIPSPEVKSYYGTVTIQKRSTADANAKLQNATFEVYQCNKNGEFVKPDFTVTQNKTEAKVTVGSTSSWTTTGANGEVAIEGLLVNDYRNGSEMMPDGTSKWVDNSFYCLVETKAPTGYELLPKPVMFQVKKTNANQSVDVVVKDVPSNGKFSLPLTGAQGITLMVVAGVLIVAGSGFYLISMTRRNREEEQE